ncbi:MAG: rhomboid family intramembrane serine protease [Phycisphaerales bacterium]|nr:rhomboid family intramembrane serine protease [Phycisphaerales bacterium]
MPIIPIGTDVRPRHAPIANYLLIAVNVLVFLFTDVMGGDFGALVKAHYSLDAARPRLYQYLTYQFLHGDILHLAGNMLFLWIFGNAVCDRMRALPYVLFYLAGGVFSGVAFTSVADNPIVGASGAIAAVTTAFMALFPRVHITILVWLVFIFTFQVPALLLIAFKMILWDNLLAPQLDQAATSNVAYSAHLGGYAFGFVVAAALLALRALPRNQFDIMALMSRSARRQGWGLPGTPGSVAARPIRVEELQSRPLDTLPLSPAELLRERISERLRDRDVTGALEDYRGLLRLDRAHVLAAPQQIEIANALAQQRAFAEAADAYTAYLEAYPAAPDGAEVSLFLGLICSRYLNDPDRARLYLGRALRELTQASQRQIAEMELAAIDGRSPQP